MATTKTIITKGVPTTATAVYTNATARGAMLKSVDVINATDPSIFTATDNTSSEWSYFGTNAPIFNSSDLATAGHGTPLTLRLSATRVLLVWTPHFMHAGGLNDFMGNNTLHTQIVEFQTNKYAAGPIVNIQLPTAPFSATVGLLQAPGGMVTTRAQHAVKLLALTATKAVLIYRIGTAFRIIRLTISGNSVTPVVASYDLTGAPAFNTTTAAAFDVAHIAGETNKIIIGGWSSGANWSLLPFSVPDSGAIDVAGALFSTTLTATTGMFAITQLNRTPVGVTTTFCVAAHTTTNTVMSVAHFTFNNTGNTFTAAGTTVTVAMTAGAGIEAQCVSNDASANAIVAWVDSTGTPGQLSYIRQTSLSQATNTILTVALSNSTVKALRRSAEWGNQRAVFLGTHNLAVVVDSNGTGTSLIPTTEATAGIDSVVQWFPFDRPIYSMHDANVVRLSRVTQWYSRSSVTDANSVGVLELNGNYLPYGHNYGGHYSWSETAQCWMVGQGGRIYALAADGTILNETSLFNLGVVNLSTNLHLVAIKQLQVFPSGKILFASDRMGTHTTQTPASAWNQFLNQWCGCTFPVNTAAELTRVNVMSAPSLDNLGATGVICDMATFVDYGGAERGYAVVTNSVTNGFVAIARFEGLNWTTFTNIGVTSTTLANTHEIGLRGNWRLIQDAPITTVNQGGLWRLVGNSGTNSSAAMSLLATSSVPQPESSFASLNCSTVLSATAHTFGVTKMQTSTFQAAAAYDAAAIATRTWVSVRGQTFIPGLFGQILPTNISLQFNNMAVSKYGATIAACNTGITNASPTAYVFDSLNSAPRFTFSGTVGNGWVTTYPISQFAWQTFMAGLNRTYEVVGPDRPKFTLSYNDGVNNFVLTPAGGQVVNPDSVYRSTDTYIIPPGHSIRIRSSLPSSIDAMISIIEEV